MVTNIHQFDSLDNLREYVNATLCDRNQLKLGAFPMTEQILKRSGKPCGIYFCLHGPRAVRFTAIWETDSNQVFFYGPCGERVMRTQLNEAPCLDSAAA